MFYAWVLKIVFFTLEVFRVFLIAVILWRNPFEGFVGMALLTWFLDSCHSLWRAHKDKREPQQNQEM